MENVPPDDEVLSACRRMKEQGYRLALDDYCDTPETQPFLAIADFVKESGAWEQLCQSARHIGLHENFLLDVYLRSVQWVTEVLADAPVMV